jgi:integrase
VAVENPKYRGILMSMYAGGLRITEACRLRPEDIDSKRKVMGIRGGKGRRDHYTLLSERLLEFLRDYWRKTQGCRFERARRDDDVALLLENTFHPSDCLPGLGCWFHREDMVELGLEVAGLVRP